MMITESKKLSLQMHTTCVTILSEDHHMNNNNCLCNLFDGSNCCTWLIILAIIVLFFSGCGCGCG